MTSSASNTNTTELIQFNPASQLPMKLTGASNFANWKAQVSSLMYGHDLYSYLDGTTIAPSQTTTVNNQDVPNPLYKLWFRQDQLIRNALMASVDPTITSTIVAATTSKQAWDALHTLYANKSHTRIFSLRNSLNKVSKDTKTIAEYLREVKCVADELATAGAPVTTEELIVKILSGLGSEYDAISAAIQARDSAISYEELFDKLISHEIFLKHAELRQSSTPITAAFTQKSNSYSANSRYNRKGPWQHQPWGSPPNRPQTQSRGPPPQGTPPPAVKSTQRVQCQLCDKFGHTARVCRSRSHNHMETRANFVSKSSTFSPTPWILDTGASHHVTTEPHGLHQNEDYTGTEEIAMGDGTMIPITHTGSTHLHASNSTFHLSNTLCAPAIKHKLISVSKFCQDNLVSIEFFPLKFLVKDLSSGTPLVCGRSKDGLYEWPHFQPPMSFTAITKHPLDLWHRRLGHPNSRILQFILNKFSLPVSSRDKISFCNSCSSNKAHRLPFLQNSLSSDAPLKRIYSDLWGPSPVLSIDKKLYYCIFVDQHTKYIWLYTLKTKNEVQSIFQKFHPLVENFFKTKVISLYTDGGGEFKSLDPYLQSHGIEHLISPPYTPQRVALAERRHRHIIETAKTLLHQASLPNAFWTFACHHATFLINRLPTPNLQNNSPYKQLFGEDPNYQSLRIFGCLCYPWLKPYAANKLAPRSKPCVYLGFSLIHHCHQCFDPINSKLFLSRDVHFSENIFPFENLFHNLGTNFSNIDWDVIVIRNQLEITSQSPPISLDIPSPIQISIPPQQRLSRAPSPPPASTSSSVPLPGNLPSPTHSPPRTTSPPQVPSHTPTISSPPNPNQTQPLISPPQSQLPVPSPPNSSQPTTSQPGRIQTRSKNNIFKPRKFFDYTAQLCHPITPTTYKQASQYHHWREAMKAEFDALLKNHTWDLVPRDSNKNVIACKWLFRVKKNPDGTIDRYKARLVAKGFTQRAGIDYHSTFSPVVKQTTIRLVLSIAVQQNWPLHQLDVNNAFLQGHLDEEVFMQQPPGFEHADLPHHVCRLRKAIYGLKQAPRAWYTELTKFLFQMGFTKSKSDHSLFILHHLGISIYILVYVDDIIVTGNNSKHIQQVISTLSNRFSLKDLGFLNYFLGVEVIRRDDGLILSQSKYVLDILHDSNMQDSKGVLTPMSSHHTLVANDGAPLTDATKYRKVIGKLQYLSFTRPDISYSVNKLSQFMHSPSENHWKAVKRVLRYLKQTAHYVLRISHHHDHNMYVYSDADWAGDPNDRTSTSGYLLYFGQSPISWTSKKQKTVARSSTEAEYRAVASAVAETNWVMNLLHELKVPLCRPPNIYCDNIGATYHCQNPVMHSKMKHIEVDFHFVRDQVVKEAIVVRHIHAADQLADTLTKALPKPAFLRHLSNLSVVSQHT